MDGLLVAAALLSALLHASWNAAVKASGDAPQAMAAQMYAAGLIALGALVWVGLPAWAALPWMAVSVSFSLGSVALLLRAYRHIAFGIAYPITRGASVMLVVPLAGALRYDSFRQSADGNTNERNADRLSPRVSLAYQVLPWLEPYIAYSEAFRSPSLTELYVSGQHFPGNSFVPNPNLRPETSRNLEAGLNIRFGDVLRTGDRLRARITAFENRIDDFIERKHGRAPITYEHPLMERHLQETYGVMVYQEQVMRLAADLAGLTLGEAVSRDLEARFERGFRELGIASARIARLVCPIGGGAVRDKRPAVIAALVAAELITTFARLESRPVETLAEAC